MDRLWGLVSALNDFEPTVIVNEKIDFSMENTFILIFEPISHPLKKCVFFIDDEGRFKIIQRLKQDLKAGPNTIGYTSSKFQEL